MKLKRTPAIIIGALVALLFLLNMFSGFFVDLWWFESLTYQDVFWTNIKAQYILWGLGFVVFLLFIYLNIRVPLRTEQRTAVDPRIEAFMQSIGKLFTYAVYAGIIFLAFIMAGLMGSFWKDALVFMHAEGFGIADPIFNNDIGFYVFQLPFIETIRGWLLGMTILTILAVLGVYVVRQGVSFSYGHVSVSAAAQKHLAFLLSLVFVLVSAGYYLDRYSILNSTRSASLFGAGYADVTAQLPAYWILTVLALFVAIGIVVSVYRRKYKQLLGLFVGFIAMTIIVGSVYPALIQKFIVNPTEQSKERPYIENNIRFTRLAYELNRIVEKPVNPELNLQFKDLLADSVTVKNIMLWDYRPLASTLDQLQVFRLYYDFPDVDVDRYHLPNGDYRQVMLSAREMNQSKLPANAQTWVNKKLVYTHGYGMSMSPVNVVTEEGLPEFFVKDIPPESSVGIEIDNPAIYYGEFTNEPIITNGNIDEFDYPEGDQNKMTKYAGDAGISMGSLFARVLFAMHFGDFNMLISQYITGDSKIHYDRNITERVRKIAPWLAYDEDPYLVVANKKFYWIYDAYTTTNRYPYSAPYQNSINYIRNSVKIVIDAYSGETTFYKFNENNDPFIRTYANIYPKMFKTIDAMPDFLHAHVRYPQDMFDIQSNIYQEYHMTDPQVFYNKEDLWNIANEKLQNNVVQMESYYALIRLPGEKKEEFIQMVPYTPNKRDNMIAWLCARSDGDNYGKMLVYKFPKQDLTYGPMQISARIDQDPVISEQLTLWDQQGSSVTRGNLLVIPIKTEMIYIQPVYLQATSGKLPELKRVIVSYANRIAMEPTLDLALASIFTGSAAAKAREQLSEDTAGEPGGEAQVTTRTQLRTIQQISREALQRYNRAQQYLKDGKWAKYGEEIEALKKDLQELSERAGR